MLILPSERASFLDNSKAKSVWSGAHSVAWLLNKILEGYRHRSSVSCTAAVFDGTRTALPYRLALVIII